MIKKSLLWILIGMIIAVGWGGPGERASAQPQNLLTNGSLEGPYYAQGGPTRTVPNGWKLWVGLGAPESIPNSDKAQVLDGAIAWKLKQNNTAFAAAGYQQVSGVSVGDTLRAAAYGWVFTCNDTATNCVTTTPPYRRSDTAAGAALKVGLDPSGGTDPLSANVRWSAAVAPYDQWAEISVSTVAQASTVTVFLYMIQTTGLAINEVYWDKATLTHTAAGDTGNGEVPFVVPQNIRPDGSIVHVVQAGDTLSSIAYAYAVYGVTVDSIAALNGLKPNTRFLQLGQQLTILPPGSVDPVTGQLVTPGSALPPTAVATATLAPDVTQTPLPSAQPPVQPTTQSPTQSPTPPAEQPTATLETVPLPMPTTGEVAAAVSATPAPTLESSPMPTLTPTATPTPTVEPSATAQAIAQATATLPSELTATKGKLCISIFQDQNLNGTRDAGENPVDQATFSLVAAGGSGDLPYLGANDPVCYDVDPRSYQVQVHLPNGYGATTPDRLIVRVVAGQRIDVVFGGAAGYAPPSIPEVTAVPGAGEGVDPGEVAPLVELPAAAPKSTHKSLLDRLYDHSAYLMLGVGGVVVLGGLVLLLLLRSPVD